VKKEKIKEMGDGEEIKDGERINIEVKDMGRCDI
jgi:hypothetical protein